MQLYHFFLLLAAACLAVAQQASSNARVPFTGLRGGTDRTGKRPLRRPINSMQSAGGPAW